MRDKSTKVSKEELQEFVKNYDGKLEKDVWAAVDPPVLTYNDFSLGKWPASIVAWVSLDYRDAAGNAVESGPAQEALYEYFIVNAT